MRDYVGDLEESLLVDGNLGGDHIGGVKEVFEHCDKVKRLSRSHIVPVI